jgi:ribonuclease PH
MPFTRGELDTLLELGVKGITEIVELQEEMSASPPTPRPLGRSR